MINNDLINDIKNYNRIVFNNDINKLLNLNNDKLYFKTNIVDKHIIILIDSFNDILFNINNINDIVSLFKISNINKKVNKDNKSINTISIAPYYLCNNLLNNNCNNSNICYGAKNEMFKNIIQYRLNNYIFFNILEYLIINNYDAIYKKILCNAIKNNKHLITNIIRINQQSDIKNNNILKILNDILLHIKKHYNKDIKFYTYTKTKNLNYSIIDKNFIINKSIALIKDPNDLKQYKNDTNIFITIDKSIKFNDIDIDNKYLCKNNCFKCKNCINKNNNITLCYKH